MDGTAYLKTGLKKMHDNILQSVKDLSDEQLHFNPMHKGNSIAFLFWHFVRTEDLIINMMVLKQKPIWNTQGWDVKLNMDPRSQGTGMSDEDARKIRITHMPDFLTYTEAVFTATQDYLDGLTEDDLEKRLDTPMGKMKLFDIIGAMNIEHGIGHIAEIEYIKGLQK